MKENIKQTQIPVSLVHMYIKYYTVRVFTKNCVISRSIFIKGLSLAINQTLLNTHTIMFASLQYR